MHKILVLLSFIMIIGCQKESKIDVQGHRGCRGLYPENSLPAFKKALELGVTTLELDLAISKDHKVLVSHEPFMNHEIALDLEGNEISEPAEKLYNLYTMPYDSIILYDCGTKMHPRFPDQIKIKVHKPLFEEVIALGESHSKTTIQYNVEIKSLPEYDGIFSPKVAKFVQLVLEVIERNGISERTTLQSFDVRALEEVKRQAPNIKTALLVEEGESIQQKLDQLSFKPDIISPYFILLDKTSVAKYHKENYQIIPWTLNEEMDIQKMIDFKVDGIISDYPNVVLELLSK